jgi:hypothetical protein
LRSGAQHDLIDVDVGRLFDSVRIARATALAGIAA